MSITAERIKKLRKQKQLTQQGLADIIESSRDTIANYENDRNKSTLAMLTLIADALDTTVEYLQGKTDNALKTSLNDSDDDGDETDKLTPNQRRIAFSIDPDISDEEREDLIKLFEIAIKNRRRI